VNKQIKPNAGHAGTGEEGVKYPIIIFMGSFQDDVFTNIIGSFHDLRHKCYRE
jgi:hypothetical protein